MEPIEFKAYVTNLGKYNEGELVGDWVSFPIDEDDFEDVLEQIGISPEYEEWFVTDYDCSLNGFDWRELGEYPSYEKLQEFGLLLDSITDVDSVENVYEVTGNLEEAIEGLERGRYYYYPGIKNARDWGYKLVELSDGVENLGIDTIENFFDYEALGRELDLDMYGENDEQTAGEYWCGDEDASYTEIGEAYVDGDIGMVSDPGRYFNYEKFGKENLYDCTFTKGGLVEEVG